MSDYNSTKYEDKRGHGPAPKPGTQAFGDMAKARRDRLLEQAANAGGKVTNKQAASMGRSREKDILREAGE